MKCASSIFILQPTSLLPYEFLVLLLLTFTCFQVCPPFVVRSSSPCLLLGLCQFPLFFLVFNVQKNKKKVSQHVGIFCYCFPTYLVFSWLKRNCNVLVCGNIQVKFLFLLLYCCVVRFTLHYDNWVYSADVIYDTSWSQYLSYIRAIWKKIHFISFLYERWNLIFFEVRST